MKSLLLLLPLILFLGCSATTKIYYVEGCNNTFIERNYTYYKEINSTCPQSTCDDKSNTKLTICNIRLDQLKKDYNECILANDSNFLTITDNLTGCSQKLSDCTSLIKNITGLIT